MKTQKKILVAYFSCSGETRRLARTVAEAVGGDLYEIQPEHPYTAADLDWNDKSSRSSLEMNDPSSRPAIAGRVARMEEYETIFIGFPIWWYVAPTIVNTFLESYDLSGKTVIPFATSGGSGMGNTEVRLRPSCSETARWLPGKRLRSGESKESVRAWVDSLHL